MCKAPKPPKPKEPKKPQFLRNKYLDQFVGQAGMVNALRTGRSNLRIPLGAPSGITGRQPGESLVPTRTTGINATTMRPSIQREIDRNRGIRNPNRPMLNER